MRTVMFGILVASIAVLAPTAVYAQRCPADPFKASTAIWKWGDIQTGQMKSARHPCGKQITCIGGRFEPTLVRRQCHWN
jgi:hypothetical protein